MLHQHRKCNIKVEKHLIEVENVIKIENAIYMKVENGIKVELSVIKV